MVVDTMTEGPCVACRLATESQIKFLKMKEMESFLLLLSRDLYKFEWSSYLNENTVKYKDKILGARSEDFIREI